VLKVNADEHVEIARKYDVRSLPTLIVFKDGVEVDRIIGAVSREMIVAKL
jgi:thioredoxin 1